MDVLVIEDDPAGRRSLTKILERAGFMVSAVENGLAAFAAIQQHEYRVIVCDILLPYMDGVEFFKQLRRDYPEMADRVLFVTAWTQEPLIRRFLEESQQPFLRKPYDIEMLESAVRGIAEPSG